MSARYFYLQLDLIGSGWTPLLVRQKAQAACEEVFGEAGAALPLDVLRVEHTPTDDRVCALLRVPAASLARARAALALAAPALRVLSHAASLQALL